MLKNIIDKETNNIFIPFKPQNDSIQVQAGGIVAWSGYAFIYKTFKTTAFKEN
ncbi:hypothetical protein ABPH35_07175 [Streptococcus sp. ZJ93]|uniref:hypothetical protein n=1 Tax=Streptococcus handemini TaxID=3161188 RepID=UPI0032ED9B5E